ncbi:hypothetical protein JQV19_19220 [Sulfitobacter mediterraneus]|uniref:hypothetical protein n=1 Tax=Sulfitobacter mediterraneus TaxID=83219 RepID=UPI0019395B1E|nr:hypothetical protein [Sulfitobacter mediterraneus]MBM1558387.1 hypothetical protein [Sulfitobacter mediterraneus]MBM1570329.1 hypothetical protein [Sulfitobacter mediterraneus]MBM1574142.1 hypothetical protein [Sulfitobacter mediterraneus]MBM1577944.1 hypothetical protein [Sulfitobacter mediterraneus]MBM1581375.1 hypothetical protein [Sulfitobacter mediterraneus]
MADVVSMSGRPPLRLQDIKKSTRAELALQLRFNREPSDEERRLIEEFLDMMVNQSGVLNRRLDQNSN